MKIVDLSKGLTCRTLICTSDFIVVCKFCFLLSVCVSCHPCIVWNSCSLTSCARCLCFLPLSFVMLDVAAGSFSRPLHTIHVPFTSLSISVLSPLFCIHFYPPLALLSSLLSPPELCSHSHYHAPSCFVTTSSSSHPSLCLASGQHQLHGVGRTDRHQRAG